MHRHKYISPYTWCTCIFHAAHILSKQANTALFSKLLCLTNVFLKMSGVSEMVPIKSADLSSFLRTQKMEEDKRV